MAVGSINPNLIQKQVANIIEKTTQKVGGYSYNTTTGRPNGSWNNQMGYGLLNAYAAVSEASLGYTNYINRSLTSNYNLSGWKVNSRNVTVASGTHLLVNFGQELIINAPFNVNSGAYLIVTWQ